MSTEFKVRRSRLRGAANARLRGVPSVVLSGPIYASEATAGIVRQPSAVTVMIPGPRPRVGVIMAGAGVTPSVRVGILNRDAVTATIGNVKSPHAVSPPTAGRRTAQGRVAVPQTAVAPAPQPRNAATGEDPRGAIPAATGSVKVPTKATGTVKVPTPGTSTGRSS